MNTTTGNISNIDGSRSASRYRPPRTDLNPVLAFKYEKTGSMILDRSLPRSAWDILIIIIGLARKNIDDQGRGYCTYTNKMLAKRTKVSLSTLKRALDGLERKCHLIIEDKRLPSGWIERRLIPSKLADTEMMDCREKMGYRHAILPVIRKSKAGSEMNRGRVKNGPPYNRVRITDGEEKIPKPHQEVGLPESVSAGSVLAEDASSDAEQVESGSADAGQRFENAGAYSQTLTGDLSSPGEVPPPDPVYENMAGAGQAWDGDIFSKFDFPAEIPVPADTAPATYSETPPADPEYDEQEDNSDVGDGHGKQLCREGWIAEIKEKHRGLADDLRSVYPDFNWENNAPQARKFVKAIWRGALNARAILLLKLYLRDAHEERDEEGNDGTWRKPQTFQALTKRNVLDRTIQLCFEAAARDREMGVGRLARPGTLDYEQTLTMYRSYFRSLDFSEPERNIMFGNMPAWVVAWGAHLQGIRYALAQRQYIEENMLSTMHRSSINNVVELVKMTGKTVEELFFIPEKEMLDFQAGRQKLDDAKETISHVIFGEQAL